MRERKRNEETMTKVPFVAFALFCERVLQEQDGVLSAIRIVDRLNLHEAPRSELPARTQAQVISGINLLIGLKSGEYKGKGTISLQAYTPTGERLEELKLEMQVELQGGAHAQQLVVQLAGLPFTKEGVYWIDVLFDGTVLTRVPLSVSVNPNSTTEPAPKPSDRPPTRQAH